MAQKVFGSVSDIIKHLKNQSDVILEELVKEYVTPAMLEQIEKVVYQAYTPTGSKPYQRRGDIGGLKDPNNIQIIDSGQTEVGSYVFIKNVAEVSGRKVNKRGTVYQLDWLICEGEFDWYNSEWARNKAHKRDFYEATKHAIEKELVNRLTQKFEQKGINVVFSVKFT